MAELKALIFDVDGTLAETERDGHRVAFNAAFAEAGLGWDWSAQYYGELLAVAGGKERIAHHIARTCPGFTAPAGQALDAFIADLHRVKTRHYLALLGQGGVPLRPGVAGLLRAARGTGVRLAIATTTAPENVDALLEHAGEPGLRGWFEVIAAGDMVRRKKPAPDIFESVMERLGLRPSDCAVIEDSDNGAKAALAAGLRSLVVTLSHYSGGQEFGAAALIVDQLGEAGSPARVMGGTRIAPLGLAPGASLGVDLKLIGRLHQAVWG